MIKRKRRNNDFFAFFKFLADPGLALLDIREHVSMRQHRTFGQSCRSGSESDFGRARGQRNRTRGDMIKMQLCSEQ